MQNKHVSVKNNKEYIGQSDSVIILMLFSV